MTLSAFLQHGRAGEPMQTQAVPVKLAPLGWHDRGQTWTATGYGIHIATRYMVQTENRWRRVYRDQSDRYAPASYYIGRNAATGVHVTIVGADD